MFKCCRCKKLSSSGEKQNKVNLETREKVYTDKDGKILGKGVETVREIAVCVNCFSGN